MKLTRIQIGEVCKNYNIWNYTINDDMSISVNGSIDFSMGRMIAIPNEITNFDGLPEFFESGIWIYGNPVYEIFSLFNEDPKCIYWIREFDVIQGNKIIKDRLEEVYVHMGLEIPKDIKFEEYILV